LFEHFRKTGFRLSRSSALLLAYHGLAALPKHETKLKTDGGKDDAESETRMSETKLREDICRFGRSLFERGLIGQYQRPARRRRLAGDADQCLARLPRSGEDVAA
jgi:hypothetical protein